MNKKFFISLLTIAAAAFLSFSVTSCSKSDDDPIGDGGDSRIIGTWLNVNSKYTCAWRFESNGKCQYTEWGKNGKEEWSSDPEDIAKWKMSGNKLNVHWTYDDGDFDDCTFIYSISEDGTTLTLSEGDHGKAGTYIKRN